MIALVPASRSAPTVRACNPLKSCHFFSAFQRYISISAIPHAQQRLPISATQTRPKAIPSPVRRRGPSIRFATSTNPSKPSQRTTHYTLFPSTLAAGPPPNGPFDIDLRTLRREFLQLQAKAHPDRQLNSADKSRAEGLSALINEAYKTLSSPLLRAQYILHLNGIDVEDDETAKIDDVELLMEVLEAREVIESAQEEGELEGVRTENEKRIARSEKVVADLCRRGDWDALKAEVTRLRYWINIQEALRGWEMGKPVIIHH